MLEAHTQGAATADDAAPLWLEAGRLVAERRRILNACLSDNTCFIGRCFEVEEDFFVRYKALFMEASRGEVLSSAQKAVLSTTKCEVGDNACMEAAYRGLQIAYPATGSASSMLTDEERSETQAFASPPPLKGEERIETQTFVLRCVGIMATAPRIYGNAERRFAKLICALLASNYLEQPFKAELSRVWDRPALQNALRAWGVFNEGDATINKKTDETIDKKAAADRAKHGLRWCALPSCAKQEGCVFDFKACSACKAVVYCSAEHGALHWTRGHKNECTSLKAAGDKPRSTADGGE